MRPEKHLENEIKLYCGQRGWAVIRTNVGSFKLPDGRWFDTGLPKGWPDLMILTNTGKAMFVETKIKPRKPTKDQIEKIEFLKSKGFIAFVCYEISEFINEV